MKRRIASQLLKLQQSRIVNNVHPFQTALSSLSYQLASDMIMDIKRPFSHICIHGKQPQMILPFLQQHNQKFKLREIEYSITIVDYLRCFSTEELIKPGSPVKEIRYMSGADSWVPEENCYDLIISSLQTHHANEEEELFRKYLRSLKPDGALVGTSFVQGTLHQLYWAYLLAENERYGGMSPKVLTFPSLGETGTHLTNAKYQLITILQHQQTVEFESFVDLLTLLQELGQSGFLRGRRKGVYKDLLLAAAALYHSQWGEKDRVSASFSMSKFIGWKFHENQPKKLKPGKQVGSVQFSQQLRRFGDEVETYVVGEDSQEPKKLK